MIFIKTTLIAAVAALTLMASGATSARVDVQALKTVLKPLPGELSAKNANWGEPEFRARTLVMIMPEAKTPEWSEIAFSFEAAEAGPAWIHLQGPWDNQKRRILFDDLNINGESVPGGEFEGDLSRWRLTGSAPLQAYVTNDPGYVRSGAKCLSVTHTGKGLIQVPIKAGKNTLSVKWRQGGMAGVNPADHPLPLNRVVNAAYSDDAAQDGTGGWSDQGPQNDLRDFDFTVTDFGGVSFALTDPGASAGKGVVTFDSPRFPTGTKEITLSPEKSGRYLYLLHTSCWNQLPAGQEIGQLVITTADGNATTLPVQAGIDLGDWRNAMDYDNAKVVYRRPEQNHAGLFLSRFALPSGPVKTITFRSHGNCVWILLGATVSDQAIELQMQNFRPGKDYKAVDLPSTQIKYGSALDLSRYVEPGPAGKYGQARVSEDGRIEFADRPGIPRYFQGFNWFGFAELTGGSRTKEQQRERIRTFAGQTHAAGYNMLRPLCLDGYLMMGAKEDMVFNPDHLDHFDYLFSELKKRGIYSYLTIAAYRMGYRQWLLGQEGHGYIKEKMSWGDEAMRKRWEALAERLLDHVNPYTKMKYRDDPAVLCVEFYNEQDLALYNLQKKQNKEIINWIRDQFIDELNHTYGQGKFDEKQVVVSPGEDEPYATDWAKLARKRLTESHRFCEQTVRKLGFQGMVTQANCVQRLYVSEVAYQTLSCRSLNVYFCHPRGYTKPGATCPQNSSASDGVDYLRQACAMRFPDRPFLISEYNHGFWNRFEFEQFMFPAYAAFQKFSGIALHENAVVLDAKPNRDFDSFPTDRASEFIGVLLYSRRDVKPAQHLLTIEYPQSFLNEGKNLVMKANSDQTYVALMTGLGVDFPGIERYPRLQSKGWQPTLRMPPAGGSRDIVTEWFTQTVEDHRGLFDKQKCIEMLRRKNILPRDNLSNADQGIYQSETGELLVDAKRQIFKIDTPKTVAITSPELIEETVSVLARVFHTVPAATALTSLDDAALGQSKHMMLVLSTIPANTGMELSADRQRMINPGTLPNLMLTGTFELDIRVQPGTAYLLYPLAYDGTRREPMALENKDGLLSIRLNTAELKHGPTPFFELVAAH